MAEQEPRGEILLGEEAEFSKGGSNYCGKRNTEEEFLQQCKWAGVDLSSTWRRQYLNPDLKRPYFMHEVLLNKMSTDWRELEVMGRV